MIARPLHAFVFATIVLGVAPAVSAQPPASADTRSLHLDLELDAIGHLSDVGAALYATSGALLGLCALSAEMALASDQWNWLWAAGALATASVGFGISASAVDGHATGWRLRFERRHRHRDGGGESLEAEERALRAERTEREGIESTARHARDTGIAGAVFLGLGAVALGLGLGSPAWIRSPATEAILTYTSVPLLALGGVLGAISIGLTIDSGLRRDRTLVARVGVAPLEGGAIALFAGSL